MSARVWISSWQVVLEITWDSMLEICFEIRVKSRILRSKYSLTWLRFRLIQIKWKLLTRVRIWLVNGIIRYYICKRFLEERWVGHSSLQFSGSGGRLSSEPSKALWPWDERAKGIEVGYFCSSSTLNLLAFLCNSQYIFHVFHFRFAFDY